MNIHGYKNKREEIKKNIKESTNELKSLESKERFLTQSRRKNMQDRDTGEYITLNEIREKINIKEYTLEKLKKRKIMYEHLIIKEREKQKKKKGVKK
jgi:hypothetical protein